MNESAGLAHGNTGEAQVLGNQGQRSRLLKSSSPQEFPSVCPTGNQPMEDFLERRTWLLAKSLNKHRIFNSIAP